MFLDPYVAITKKLYPARGKIAFKTCNKDKSARYGLNFQSLGISTWSYVYWSVTYAGKPNSVTDTHITKVDDLVMNTGTLIEGVNMTWTDIIHQFQLQSSSLRKILPFLER